MPAFEQPNRSGCMHRRIGFLPCILSALILLAAAVLTICLFPHRSFADSSVSEEDAADIRLSSGNSFLDDTSIYDLDNADASYQGETVQVTGEVVGDAIRAEGDPGKHWIVLDDTSGHEGSVSVLVDDRVLDDIDAYGAYGEQGTRLRVKGVFSLACSDHDGIMDIHADSVTAVEPGKAVSDPLNFEAFIPGIVACSIGLGLTVLFHILRERER